MSAEGLFTAENLQKAAPVTINFLILAGALFYYLKTPVITFVRARHERMKSEIDSVRSQLASAQAKYDEYTAKLSSLDTEVISLRESTLRDAEQMQERIIREATRQAETILSDAKQAAATVVADFKNNLAADFGMQVIDRAEAVLKEQLRKEHQRSIRQEFAHQVEVAR